MIEKYNVFYGHCSSQLLEPRRDFRWLQLLRGWIQDEENAVVYGVEPICRVLPIALSTYHEHAARQADPFRSPTRAMRDAVFKAQVRRVFDENFGAYGVQRSGGR